MASLPFSKFPRRASVTAVSYVSPAAVWAVAGTGVTEPGGVGGLWTWSGWGP
jgi:hypothetical protein